MSFYEKKSRLDSFFVDLIHGNAKYRKYWIVFKIVFTLSHRQAAVEKGFSVNEELLVENLQQTSLISQRLICDYVSDFSKAVDWHIRDTLQQWRKKEMQQFHRRKASNGDLSFKRLLK